MIALKFYLPEFRARVRSLALPAFLAASLLVVIVAALASVSGRCITRAVATRWRSGAQASFCVNN
jgi:hypothetical protein